MHLDHHLDFLIPINFYFLFAIWWRQKIYWKKKSEAEHIITITVKGEKKEFIIV